jgi:serine/threonine-protein kinase
VEAAHASGIVHRDLKPQNLFVARRDDGTDVVKILDFGVAKLEAEDHGAGTTRTGAVLGTPAYMSPEQARGDKVVDQRSDVYSLGAVLYELLSGEKPHPGDSPNAILYHIASHPPVPLASSVPELPAGLVAGIDKALSREPGDRPASAAEFAETLKPFAVREVYPAPKLEPSSPTSPSVAATELAAAQAAPSLAVSAVDTSRAPSSEKPSRRAASALVWVALGAGLAVAIGWAGRQRTDEAAQTPETRVVPPAAAGSGAVATTPTPATELHALPSAGVVEPPAASVTRTAPGSPPGRPSGRPSGRPPEPTRAEPGPPPGTSAVPTPPAPSSRFDQRNPYDEGP